MSDYYREVGAYFDEDASDFEKRYWANPILQRIRQSFREEVERLPFRRALDVGCGFGLDLVHFALVHLDRELIGIDVSTSMIDLARARIAANAVTNARARVASADDAPELLGPEAFDLCYVFFGALNTVENLEATATRLYDALRPGGHLVLTFVNRWYLAEVLIGLVRGRWRRAFDRPLNRWSGYAPGRPLPSQCRSPDEVQRAFGGQGQLLGRRGYSIVYPAWYRAHWLGRLRRAAQVLWDMDRWLSRTPAWSLGEYALYVYRKAPGRTGGAI